MEQMLGGLQRGFLLAVVVIFLLLAFNFQSLRLAFTVVSTVPAVAGGVIIALWLTHTTLDSNRSWARSCPSASRSRTPSCWLRLRNGRAWPPGTLPVPRSKAHKAALRPILMTSIAMIAGMLPMALGFGESGDQTAPLGRAVIGGLFCDPCDAYYFAQCFCHHPSTHLNKVAVARPARSSECTFWTRWNGSSAFRVAGTANPYNPINILVDKSTR